MHCSRIIYDIIFTCSLHNNYSQYSRTVTTARDRGITKKRVVSRLIGAHEKQKRDDWKCGSGKCDTVKYARVENAGVGKPHWTPNRYYTTREPQVSSCTHYPQILSEWRVILVHCKIVAFFVLYSDSLPDAIQHKLSIEQKKVRTSAHSCWIDLFLYSVAMTYAI